MVTASGLFSLWDAANQTRLLVQCEWDRHSSSLQACQEGRKPLAVLGRNLCLHPVASHLASDHRTQIPSGLEDSQNCLHLGYIVWRVSYSLILLDSWFPSMQLASCHLNSKQPFYHLHLWTNTEVTAASTPHLLFGIVIQRLYKNWDNFNFILLLNKLLGGQLNAQKTKVNRTGFLSLSLWHSRKEAGMSL